MTTHDRSGGELSRKLWNPRSASETLWHWLDKTMGVRVAKTRVCPEHTSPWEFFCSLYFDRPSLALVLGSRGAGKSYLSALHTHLVSQLQPGHGTRILGGSRSQSLQVYEALADFAQRPGLGPNPEEVGIARLKSDQARYRNGSEVSILAASSTSVRGPHVPSLKLDEIDEIDAECREAAIGMCMGRKAAAGSILMTSTWHRVGGPMSELMEQARSGAFPLYTFCAFEVLEACPDERSGPHMEHCGECPLIGYCHDVPPGTLPKAKRSRGHYSIDSLIQKMRATSVGTFEADYLCLGPRADGNWYSSFSTALHVTDRAEYDPAWPVHLSIDPGVFTGAVFFQVVTVPDREGPPVDEVHVFADYLAEDRPPEVHARALLRMAESLCNGRLDYKSTDPAGHSRTSIGLTVVGEFERAGLRPLSRWPTGPVSDGLALIDSFLNPATGQPRLLIHPRCKSLIQAFQNYRRAKRGGQWQDYPEDPQHPHEDLMDSLRGGLRRHYPEGRAQPAPVLHRVPARQVL